MDAFEWKPVGESWRGTGIYLLTLVVQGRKPLLGSLAITLEGKPYVRRTALGMAVADEFLHIDSHYPQVKTLVFQVMPDHFHGVIHVQQELPVSVRVLVRGFKQGCNRRWQELQDHGGGDRGGGERGDGSGDGIAAQTTQRPPQDLHPPLHTSAAPAPAAPVSLVPPLNGGEPVAPPSSSPVSLAPPLNGGKPIAPPSAPASLAPPLNGGGCEGPLFDDTHLRSLVHRGQLTAMLDYVRDNPRRLFLKRGLPELFRIRRGLQAAEATLDAVGNLSLLQRPLMAVHCRRAWNDEETRAYQNRCILTARAGAVLTGAFISKAEKAILDQAHREGLPVIHLLTDGIATCHKPVGKDFDACAAGLLLQLSPWPSDWHTKTLSRDQCQRLNALAERLAATHNQQLQQP